MNTRLTPRALKSYLEAAESIQKSFDKQTGLLADNLRHPSLHAKKYDETNNIWQARVNKSWRFYFLISGDAYVIVDLSRHPK